MLLERIRAERTSGKFPNRDRPLGYDAFMSVMLNRGIYDVAEVAHLLAVDPERVVRWATPDSRGSPAIAGPSFDRAFSFAELVSFAIALEIRQRGVSDLDVRRGLQVLREEHRVDHPLALRDVVSTIGTSGASLVAKLHGQWFDVGKGRQAAFDSIIELYPKHLRFDDAGAVSAWAPVPHILLDPQIQAGAPCVAGTRITTATIHALLDDDSIDEVADEYGLSIEEVDAADKFEQRLLDGVGLAA